MDNILNQLIGQLGENGIASIAGQIGADNNQTKEAIGGIIPVLLGAMANNSKTQEGANGLLGALDKDHDGSILDNLGGFINNFSDGPGEGILKHVLGSNESNVQQGLSAKTGLSSSQIANLMKIAAPIILGYLGRQKRSANTNMDANGLSDLLGGMTRQTDQSTGIDLGDILSIVGGLSGGNQSSQGGIGGLLGKLFRR
jgi:hypothetical protein